MQKPIIERKKDGGIDIQLQLTADEVKELNDDLTTTDAAASRKTYCCFCHDNEEYKEVRAWNSVEAAVKCGLECAGGFTMHRGECSPDDDQ